MDEDSTIPVDSLPQFIQLLSQWHANKVATLKHLTSIPEGTDVVVDEQSVMKLEGDTLKGFRVGLETALMELGTLPFAVEFEPDSVNESTS